MAKVAFIGLGTMGYPMAGHLAKAGHDVCVYNRTHAKAESWVSQYGHRCAQTPSEAAEGAEFVMTCVGNDNDLAQVTLGEDGVLKSLKPNAILIDHTTASAEIARTLSNACEERGCEFLDAPVSGGQAGAENGVLSVMAGGGHNAYLRAEPVIAAYAKASKHLGAAGSGQLTKMVNQICIAGLLQGLAEATHFLKRSGLDGEEVFDVIQHGAAGSWQMVNRHKTMLNDEFDFGFAVDWMRKDLSLVLDEARRNGARLPVTALVDQFYADVQNLGGGRWDTSSLLKRLEPGE
ncbi:2-hydroxy-3-oxopropionate reductase [Marinobacterium lacunae]|uniref:2-hydroxy-3-oxopropionate reductase n=1 Tax=Marinobacterium lacunae TaxID=1232683 RepID=A0A081FTM2_9GAMM|nr:NAD(P)-dependent oxidoreductase [Marinobacterium lacunae]KEA61877.1 2-hydroxy-3-oxopropionate reductase [Marinobacterium lacunae]MBR9884318.1 NAD(P)-dependent oxidoreductase [Oceanospirillales bacterium]